VTLGRPAAVMAAAVVLLATLPGCGVQDLNFVQDDRVTITAPKDRASVRLPVTLRWTSTDFDGTYAVFVDRAPVPPGRDLRWLARDDELCDSTPGCPNDAWLRDRAVFATPDTSLTIDELPDLNGDSDRREFHEATVVLLDRDGRRVGEAAFTVEFEVAGR
jgi:hypothetical protein